MKRLTLALLITLFLLTTTGTVAQVAEQDSLALKMLYHATDGATWTNNTNWLSAPVSEWFGVTITGDRVTSLRLSSNHLTGEIPAEIGNLTALKHLRLSSNRLTGAIPTELGNLARLRDLRLSSNQLTGAIPTELGNLPDLEVLFLWSNQLTGEVPSELGNLTNLEVLSLSSNQLTGAIPANLGNLPNLEILALGSNQLTGTIPANLGNLARLEVLSLSSNQLTGAIPAELGRLTFSYGLYLSSNQLTGEVPSELGDLAHLKDLHLNKNAFSGSLPMSLTNLANLTSFNFSNTGLCGPSDAIFLVWLQTIPSVTTTGITCIPTASEEVADLPTHFALEANYPNPFNPTTHIRYELPTPVQVRLTVYDGLGRLVDVLVDAVQSAGGHEVTFEASALPSGVYFYRLEAGAFQDLRQMLLLK